MEIYMKKRYLLMLILALLTINYCFITKKISQKHFDEYSTNQWFLKKEFTGTLTMDNPLTNLDNTFTECNEIKINSKLDLGLENNLKNNKNKNSKHITIALIDSCVDIK